MGTVAAQPWAPRFPSEIDIPSRCFGEADVALFGDLTDDHNPIHSDGAFAAKTPFGSPIVFGFLFVMPVWPALRKALGPDALSGADVTIRFFAPVFVGRTAHYAGHLVHADPDRAVYEFTVSSEPDKVAATITVTIVTANTKIVAGPLR